MDGEHAAHDLVEPLPHDEHDLELLRNVRPPDWRNPEPAPLYDLVVVGAGTAGLVSAAGAATLGARVALVERNLLGGDCLNAGCVPSKALLRTARFYADLAGGARFGGAGAVPVATDFPGAMERMRRIRARISRHDAAARFRDLGVDVFLGEAAFVDPRTVAVAGARLRFRKAVLATGSRAARPEIDGLEETGYLTNESVFDLTEDPGCLAVIGGGPIGCELSQAFRRFGCRVILIQREPQFLPREERDAALILSQALERDGIEVRLNTQVTAVSREGGRKRLHLSSDGRASQVDADEILVGVGRTPIVEGLGLEAAGVAFDARRGVQVDDFLRTTNPRIFAAGDVALAHKFTHMADASARIALQNALFLGRKRLSALVVPWCTYTDPEIAHVGVSVREAAERDLTVTTFTVPISDVDRAVTDSEEEGFVKIHVKAGTDRILGATIVARHAGEMIHEITLAMVAGIGLKTIARVIHSYPTQAEAIRKAADAHALSRLTPRVRRLASLWLRTARRFAGRGSETSARPG